MPVDQCITEDIPLLNGSQEKVVKRILKLRTKLEVMFRDLNTAVSVVIVCCGQLREQHIDADIDVERILREYVDGPIDDQLSRLHKIIEKLGGTTEFSESVEDGEGDEADSVLMALGAGGEAHG